LVPQAVDVHRQQVPLVDYRARDFVSDPRPGPGFGADQHTDNGGVRPPSLDAAKVVDVPEKMQGRSASIRARSAASIASAAFMAAPRSYAALARVRVLQRVQKCPEMAGSDLEGIAKPSEKFQRLGPKTDRLPIAPSARFRKTPPPAERPGLQL
jgi:hypothetical protein